MAVFKGYLLKATAHGGVSAQIFPHEYIKLESWDSTPNQREEIKAYRDDNTRNLTRVTASGKKTVFSFSTLSGLHKSEKETIISFFTSHEINGAERKIHLEYWNDEEATYKEGDFYRPNMNFPIKKITEDDIVYGELKFEFVEY